MSLTETIEQKELKIHPNILPNDILLNDRVLISWESLEEGDFMK